MAALKTNLGKIPCPECGDSTALKQNEAGTLTLACQECDLSCFAKKGSGAAKRWLAKLPKEPVPQPGEPKLDPATKQAPKAAFDMNSL